MLKILKSVCVLPIKPKLIPACFNIKIFHKSVNKIFINKMSNYRHVQTQHGNCNFVDEENITVLNKFPSNSNSEISNADKDAIPVPKSMNDKFQNQSCINETNPGDPDQQLSEMNMENGKQNENKEECVWFHECEIREKEEAFITNSKNKSEEANIFSKSEKRKVVVNDLTERAKKPKLESKDSKTKRPGFSDDRYDETSYYFQNGLRKVYPYYFTFTTFTKGRWVGEKILDVFSREFRAHPAEEYEKFINIGSLTVNYEKVPTDYILKHNDLLANIVHRHEVPVTNQPIKIIEMDEDILVVDKPPSIPVHPCGRYRHNTAIFILAKEYNLKNLRTIHRLDRLTSGILLFGRNPKKARDMERQIRNREVKKQYVCLVEGEFPNEIIDCNEPIECVSYKIGVCKVSPKGKSCTTSFQKVKYDENTKTSTVLCRPRTGRMHQIRVHLQYLGYPIVNDPLYNHEVFGPNKGKGGDIGGKTDEQLVTDLITIHNAENWLGGDGDPDLFKSAPNSLEHNVITDNKNTNESNVSEIETNNEEDSSLSQTTNLNSIDNNVINKVAVATQTGHDPPDLNFDPTKMTKEKHCYECKLNFSDPKPKDLIMYLHAWKYEGPDWKYETDLPLWAKFEPIKDT